MPACPPLESSISGQHMDSKGGVYSLVLPFSVAFNLSFLSLYPFSLFMRTITFILQPAAILCLRACDGRAFIY